MQMHANAKLPFLQLMCGSLKVGVGTFASSWRSAADTARALHSGNQCCMLAGTLPPALEANCRSAATSEFDSRRVVTPPL